MQSLPAVRAKSGIFIRYFGVAVLAYMQGSFPVSGYDYFIYDIDVMSFFL